MELLLAAWIADAVLAAVVSGAVFLLWIRLGIDVDLFTRACGRLLSAGEYDRFEKLMGVMPRSPLATLLLAAWRKRGEPAPIEASAFGGYREAQVVPSYAERMKAALAPEIAETHRRLRRAVLPLLPGLLAPPITWVLIGPPLTGPWVIALVTVALAGSGWHVARKHRRAIASTLEVLLPLMDPHRGP